MTVLTKARIEWSVPSPRAGWRGAVDRFFGPGPTRAEVVVQAVGVPLLAATLLAASGDVLGGLGPLGVLVLVLFAVDGAGGILTNSTGTAKRWYHRPGTRGERLRFVGLHVVHVALLAWLVMGDAAWFWVTTGLLVLGAVVVEWTPWEVKRPTAAGLLVAGVVVSGALTSVPAALTWVPLVLFAKLLVAHLVPEAPFRRPT
ncbi:hypothetical protein [Aeromicrobium sp. CTD01-1L150]|uniref:hypothetical protein n=1 Tax=Aeromicrobium sp. CTD01-1L150 TaxID=3341830 RepID=UPI0035C18E86